MLPGRARARPEQYRPWRRLLIVPAKGSSLPGQRYLSVSERSDADSSWTLRRSPCRTSWSGPVLQRLDLDSPTLFYRVLKESSQEG